LPWDGSLVDGDTRNGAVVSREARTPVVNSPA